MLSSLFWCYRNRNRFEGVTVERRPPAAVTRWGRLVASMQRNRRIRAPVAWLSMTGGRRVF